MLAEESMDRILNVTEMMKERISDGSADLQSKFYEKYRAFLESELEKLKAEEQGDVKPYAGDEGDRTFY